MSKPKLPCESVPVIPLGLGRLVRRPSNSTTTLGWRTCPDLQGARMEPGTGEGPRQGEGTRWQGGQGHILADGSCPLGGKGLCAPNGLSPGSAVLLRGLYFLWHLALVIQSFLGKRSQPETTASQWGASKAPLLCPTCQIRLRAISQAGHRDSRGGGAG